MRAFVCFSATSHGLCWATKTSERSFPFSEFSNASPSAVSPHTSHGGVDRSEGSTVKHRIATLPFVRWPTGPRRDQQTTSRQRWALLASLSPRPCSGHGAVGPCRSMKNRRCSPITQLSADRKACYTAVTRRALSDVLRARPSGDWRVTAQSPNLLCGDLLIAVAHGALRCKQAGIDKSSGASFIGFATASSVPGASNP